MDKEKKQVPLPEKKKIEPIVSSPAVRKPKSKTKKFLNSFFTEDLSDIKKNIVQDYIKPSSQDWLRNCLIFIINACLGGSGKPSSSGIGINYVDYNKASRSNIRSGVQTSSVRSVQRFDDIFVGSRGEAEEVIEALQNEISLYGIASVADLNDMLGIPGHFTDEKYGWSNIDGARIERITYNKYLIVLPDASPIN